jgi:hypothetical protein
MYRDVLSSIDGIALFPISGLIIFFVLFIYMLYRVLRIPKEEIDKNGKIPLDE